MSQASLELSWNKYTDLPKICHEKSKRTIKVPLYSEQTCSQRKKLKERSSRSLSSSAFSQSGRFRAAAAGEAQAGPPRGARGSASVMMGSWSSRSTYSVLEFLA